MKQKQCDRTFKIGMAILIVLIGLYLMYMWISVTHGGEPINTLYPEP